MSLIYSALTELDEQARNHSPDHVVASAPPQSNLWRQRAGIIAGVALLLAVVGTGMYLLAAPKRPLAVPPVVVAAATITPATNATAPVVLAPVTQAPAAMQSTLGSAMATATPTVGAAAPHVVDIATPVVAAGTAQPEAAPYIAPPRSATRHPTGETGPRVVITNGPTATWPLPTATTPAVDTPPIATQATAAPMPQATDDMIANSGPSTTAPAAAAAPTPAAPATAARSDTPAPYLGSNNFVKVGTQAETDNDQGVASQVAAFEAAMASGSHVRARSALAAIKARLPAQSMTVLRMQAWYAMDTGDTATARDTYQQVLERLPTDVNAGINVALIDWQSNRQQAARRRIGELHTSHPDDPLIARYWQAMQGGGDQ